MLKKYLACKNRNLKENFKNCPIYGIKLETAQEVSVQEQLNLVNVKKTLNVHGMNVKIELTASFNESIIGKPVKIFTDGIADNLKSLSTELIEKVNDSFS